jgi:hypothetical protein
MKINFEKDLIQTIQTRILRLLDKKHGQWNGTMTELNVALTSGINRATLPNWPGSPSILRQAVNRALPALRRQGVKANFERSYERIINLSQHQNNQ